jgi:hypothetical protein
VASGVLHGTCSLDSGLWVNSSFGNGAQQWLYKGFSSPLENATCDAWVEHDIYFIVRYDTQNVFHLHEDVMQAWSSMVVAGVDASMVETVILDGRDTQSDKHNIYWEKVFTGDRVLRHLKRTTPFYQNPLGSAIEPQNRDIRQIAEYYKQRGVRTLCFSRGIFGPHGGVSPLSRDISRPTECRPEESALFLGLREYALEALAVDISSAPIKASTPVRISFSSRRNDANGRTISNEAALLKRTMRRACDKWEEITLSQGNDSKYAPLGSVCGVSLQVVDFGAGLSTLEQIGIAHSTDILIGAHGAGLTLTFFQPYVGTVSGLIEVQHLSAHYNYHFQNIASKLGNLYFCRQSMSGQLSKTLVEEISQQAVEFAIQIHEKRGFRRYRRRR